MAFAAKFRHVVSQSFLCAARFRDLSLRVKGSGFKGLCRQKNCHHDVKSFEKYYGSSWQN